MHSENNCTPINSMRIWQKIRWTKTNVLWRSRLSTSPKPGPCFYSTSGHWKKIWSNQKLSSTTLMRTLIDAVTATIIISAVQNIQHLAWQLSHHSQTSILERWHLHLLMMITELAQPHILCTIRNTQHWHLISDSNLPYDCYQLQALHVARAIHISVGYRHRF